MPCQSDLVFIGNLVTVPEWSLGTVCSKYQLSSSTEAKDSKICRNKPLEVPANKIFENNQLYVRLFKIFDLTIYVHIFRHFVDFMHAHLPSTNDCQKSLCHFTAAKIQYAFLHHCLFTLLPFNTTANLHHCLFTLLPKYRRAVNAT